jgi:hypothetical protein
MARGVRTTGRPSEERGNQRDATGTLWDGAADAAVANEVPMHNDSAARVRLAWLLAGSLTAVPLSLLYATNRVGSRPIDAPQYRRAATQTTGGGINLVLR